MSIILQLKNPVTRALLFELLHFIQKWWIDAFGWKEYEIREREGQGEMQCERQGGVIPMHPDLPLSQTVEWSKETPKS
jgi:hypothetical protein